MTRLRARLPNQEGTALLITLMAMMLLTALGAAVVMIGTTESAIAGNYRNSHEALYAADAAVERVVQDLWMVPRWNDILSGTATSAFVDGPPTAEKRLPGGGVITLTSTTAELQADTDAGNMWGANGSRWALFAWGPMNDMLPTQIIDSPMYVAVWVADDPAETDGNPLADVNGVLTLRAEAIGPSGTRKVVEVTVARTSSPDVGILSWREIR